MSFIFSPYGEQSSAHSLDALQKSAIPSGEEATGKALTYDEGLLSGNPQKQCWRPLPQPPMP